jgi:hypothetical protein
MGKLPAASPKRHPKLKTPWFLVGDNTLILAF